MKPASRSRSLLAAAVAGLSTSSRAHDGHGLFGSHWHASDSWGFVALALAIAVGIWLARGGKP